MLISKIICWFLVAVCVCFLNGISLALAVENSQGTFTEAQLQEGERIPEEAIAKVNDGLTLYQLGREKEALQTFRYLAKKYPAFADTRAALTAILWEQGQQGEAESNWVAVVGLDRRYQDLDWVKTTRRWPPRLVTALGKFLALEN